VDEAPVPASALTDDRAGRFVRLVRRAPLTVGLVGALWVLGALTGSLLHGPSPELAARVGAGLHPLADGAWWGLATSALWCQGLDSYLLSTAMVLALLPVAERRIGSLRTAGLALVVQVGGSLIGLGVVALLDRVADGRWADQLAASVAVGPGTAVVGCVLAVSAGLPALWRRRLRLVLVIALVMLALYSGLIGDLLRLAAGLLGLVLGVPLFGRRRSLRSRASARHPRTARPTRAETRVLVALVVGASALGPLIAAWAQTRVGPLSVLRFVFAAPAPDPATVAGVCADGSPRECAELQARLRFSGVGPALLSIMPVLLLLVAAEGLRRGRRAAWGVAVGLNLGLTALGLVLAASPMQQRIVLGVGVHLHAFVLVALPLLQPLLVVGLLVTSRRVFDVHAPVGTYRGLVKTVVGAFALVSVLYVTLGWGLRGGFAPSPDLAALLRDLPQRLVPGGYLIGFPPAFLPTDWAATLLFEWTGPAFWLVVVVAAARTLARPRLRSAEPDRDRVRDLVAVGGGTLAHMATWTGHTYWFTEKSAVAYRVIGGVAVTTGGPVGARDPQAVAGFAAYCRDQGWTPCFYSIDAAVAGDAEALGWRTVQVAEETVLPLADLRFTGKKWQDVRTALNKAGKAGITAEWTTFASAPLAVVEQIRAISEEWVADKGLPEMGFTLGGLDELADPAVRLLLAVDEERAVHGVTSWLPVHRDGAVVGWTLDFMRRRSDDGAFRGVMEFLIASAALSCQAEDAEFLSLSGAPLARLDRGERPLGLVRLLDAAGRRLEPVYGFRSLLAFKAKFQPEYRPWYLAYPETAALPAIGNALARAYLPDLTTRQTASLARALLR
jgi:phosphatidylglycerol lysyltransferase